MKTKVLLTTTLLMLGVGAAEAARECYTIPAKVVTKYSDGRSTKKVYSQKGKYFVCDDGSFSELEIAGKKFPVEAWGVYHKIKRDDYLRSYSHNCQFAFRIQSKDLSVILDDIRRSNKVTHQKTIEILDDNFSRTTQFTISSSYDFYKDPNGFSRDDDTSTELEILGSGTAEKVTILFDFNANWRVN